MWRLWLVMDPRRTLIAVFAGLFAFALIMHFIMLSTERFNFLGPRAKPVESSSIQYIAPAKPSKWT